MWRRGLDLGMRQQVHAGSKARPKLADHQGCQRRPLGQRNGFRGAGWGGAQSEEADRTGRISESKTWLPSSAPGTVGQGAGRDAAGTGSPQDSPLTSHSPAWPSLGASGRSRRPGPASSAAPFRVTRPGRARPSFYGGPRGPLSSVAEGRASGACVVAAPLRAGRAGGGARAHIHVAPRRRNT